MNGMTFLIRSRGTAAAVGKGGKMIDLNLQKKQKEEDTPIGVQLLVMVPMVMLFWSLIEWGLR